MKTIAIMNVKGGVGKTVTTVNMATILAEFYGKRVLVIDADPQGDTSAFFDAPKDAGNLAAMMTGLCDVYSDAISLTDYHNVDILPSSTDLFDLDLSTVGMKNYAIGTIQSLRDAAEEDDAYDVIIVDCPPSFTAASIAALYAADSVIIPVKLDAFSVRGMEFLLAQVRELHRINGKCKVDGCLVTQWHNVDVIRQAESMLRDKGVPVFSTHIRRSDKVDESTWYCEPLAVYSKYSSAGVDYRCFVSEWIQMGGLNDGV